jgi:phosphate/sulfate permease
MDNNSQTDINFYENIDNAREKRANIFMLLLALGIILGCIVFGYTVGYKIGNALGEDITEQAISTDSLTN